VLILPKDLQNRERAQPNPEQTAKMVTLRISGGRKDKLRPGDILGALTGEACGLQGVDIGKIEIQDDYSYVAVSKSVSQAAQRGLTTGRIKRKRFKVDFVD
jgi:ATP-independent RNA helicase DbpA